VGADPIGRFLNTESRADPSAMRRTADCAAIKSNYLYKLEEGRVLRCKRLEFCFAILLVTCVVTCGCRSQSAPPPQMPAVPVTTAVAAQRDLPIQLRAIGNVESYASIPVKAQVGGEGRM
jgi:hypothetical protein